MAAAVTSVPTAVRARLFVQERRHVLALVAAIALGAGLRFATLGAQSLWLDEAFTIDVIRRPFVGMLREIPHTGSTPPLYYVLVWFWARAFGLGAIGVRSFSALAGTAAIPVVYAATKRLVSPRAGLVAAAVVATNPLLVWYSQEARDYALLVLASSISLYFFAEALERPTVRVLALWAVSGFVAVAAHYFALFLLAGEAAILLSRVPRRRLLLVGAPFLVPTAALVPLVARQSALSKYPLALRTRLWELVRQLLVADYPAPHLQVVALLGLAAALVLFAVWPSGRERRGATFGIVLAASTVGIPILFALVGRDFVYYRNLIDVTLPFALFAGAVLGARRAGPAGLAVAAGVCALSVVVSTQIWRNESLHRDDWSAAVRSLGPPTSRRLVVTGPWDWFPLRLYRKNLRPLRATSADVDEIELIGVIVPSKLHPPAGFNLIEWRRAQRITVVRYRAARPQHVAPTDIRPRGTPWWHAGIFVDAP